MPFRHYDQKYLIEFFLVQVFCLRVKIISKSFHVVSMGNDKVALAY